VKKSIVSAMYSERPRFFLESNGDQLKNKPNGRPLFHNLVRRNDNKGKGERSGFSQTYFAIEYCNQSKSLSNVEALTMGKFGKELIESANEAIAMSDSYEMSNYYRLTATVFWESAKVLNADFVAKGKPLSGNIFSVPFYHLVSHAAELLLKCAILKRNGSVKSLKKLPVRHSLSLLLKELQKSNIPITEKTVSDRCLNSTARKTHSEV
jgi:hypothetical protein